MKRKLFLLFALMLGLVTGANATVTWTGSTPENNGIYYLYNVGTGKILSRGGSWSSQAVINETGVPFKVTIANGKYTLTFLDSNKKLFETTDHNIYTDYNNSGTTEATVATSGDGYTITYSSGTIGVSGSGNNTALSANTSTNNVWKFITADNYQKNRCLEQLEASISAADEAGATSSSAYTAAKAITSSNTVAEIVTATSNLYATLGSVPTFTYFQAASRNCFLSASGVALGAGGYNANNLNNFRLANYVSSNGDSYLFSVNTGGFVWSQYPTENKSGGFYTRKAYPAKTDVIIDNNKWYFGVYGFDNTTPTKYINGYSATSIGTYNNDKSNNENKWFGVPSSTTVSLATLYNTATGTTTSETDNAKLRQMLDNFLVARTDLYNNAMVFADADGYLLSNASGTLSLVTPASATQANVEWTLTYSGGASYLTNGGYYLAANGSGITAVSSIGSANAVTLYNESASIVIKLGDYYLTAEGTILSSSSTKTSTAALAMRSWARESLIIDGYEEAATGNDPTSSYGYDLIILDAYKDLAVDGQSTANDSRLKYVTLNSGSNYQIWTTTVRAASSTSTEGVVLENKSRSTYAQSPATWNLRADGAEVGKNNEYLFTLLSNGAYTIEDHAYSTNDRYWGSWSGGISTITSDRDMAGNKQFFSVEVENLGLYKIYYKLNPLKAAQAEWQIAYNTAVAARDNTEYANVVGTEKTGLISAITTYAEKPGTKDGCETATAALSGATATFTAAKPNYDALVTEIAKAKALGIASATADGYAATSSSTAATALTSTQNLKVAEYNLITSTYTESATLGPWTEDFAEDLNGEGYVASGDKYWNEWGTATRTGKQTLTLPAGDYAVSVIARGATNTSGYLYYKIGDADAVTTDFNMKGNRGKGVDTSGAANFGDGTYTCDGQGFGWEYNFLKISLAEASSVEIGVSATFSNTWVSIYKPQLRTTESNIKALRLHEIETALSGVPTGKMNATVKSTLDSKVNAAEGASEDNTKEELNTILSELNTAIANANTSVAAYAPLGTTLTTYAGKAALLDAAGKAAYDVDDIQNGYDNGTYTDNEITGAITSVQTAYIAAVKAQGAGSNMTDVITNPSFEDGEYTTGWSTTAGNDTGRKLNSEANYTMTGVDGSYLFNTWANGNTGQPLTQTLTSMPAGYYRLTAVMATDKDQTLQLSVNDGTPGTASSSSQGKGEGVTVSVDAYLASAGNFKISAGTANNHWYKADNFRLTYLGDTEVNLTVSDGKLGTFIAPFDITLPENVKAYSATVDGTTVKLAKVADGGETLDEGTPVIVYGDGTSVNTNFYGNATVTENQTSGALVGILKESAKTVPAGSYVLQTQSEVQAFYQVASAAPGVLYRCYLTSGSGSARLVISIDEDNPNAINAIEAADVKAEGLKDGKYLIGNKIILVKNAVKYGANGQKLK